MAAFDKSDEDIEEDEHDKWHLGSIDASPVVSTTRGLDVLDAQMRLTTHTPQTAAEGVQADADEDNDSYQDFKRRHTFLDIHSHYFDAFDAFDAFYAGFHATQTQRATDEATSNP